MKLALEQEKQVTAQISRLASLAREENDLVGAQFLDWFLKEQREEVASMSELLSIVTRAAETNLLSPRTTWRVPRSATRARTLRTGGCRRRALAPARLPPLQWTATMRRYCMPPEEADALIAEPSGGGRVVDAVLVGEA